MGAGRGEEERESAVCVGMGEKRRIKRGKQGEYVRVWGAVNKWHLTLSTLPLSATFHSLR